MTIQPVTLIKGDDIGLETEYRDALPVNMYAVERQILGAAGYMTVYPGLELHGLGSGIDRGAVYNERFGMLFRVSGTDLITVSSDGVTTIKGTIIGSGPCILIDNASFNTQAIIGEGRMYLAPSTGIPVEVTDADLGSPIDGVWVNGVYFLTDGEYIYHTDLADESSINPLKYATAEFMPDPSLGVAKTRDNKVLVFGRYTIECFADAANPNFAFTRIETRALKIGIVGTYAKCSNGDNYYILGSRRQEALAIHIIKGSSVTKISTREVDKIIAEYPESSLTNVRLEIRQDNDITFLLVHLPGETLYFNEKIASKFGIEFAWGILKTGLQSGNYRGINGTYDPRNGKWIYGDKYNETLGYLDYTKVTQYGDEIEWILYTPFIDLEALSVNSVEIETIPGITLIDDAKVAMSITYDGQMFGTEYWMNYGSPSDYGRRFILRRLGYCKQWMGFKFRSTSKSRIAFALMEVDVD